MSYFSLPSIKCSDRKNVSGLDDIQDKCTGFNPDNIYNSLFPGFNKPMSKFNNVTGEGFDQIGKTKSNISKDKCAESCLQANADKGCKYMSYQDSTQTCSLYGDENPQTAKLTDDSKTSKLYRKISDNGCNSEDSECIGCNVFCNDKNYELKKSNVNVSGNPLSKTVVSSISKCEDKCNEDVNCKSFLYENQKSKCNIFKEKVNTSSNVMFQIKDELNNRVTLDYLKYYNSYSKDGDGKVGDYTCGLNSSTGDCYTITQKKCTTNVGEDYGVDSTDGKSKFIKMYKYPLNYGNTASSSTGDGRASKVSINNFKFSKCISNSGSCIDTVYTNDNSGFPQRDRKSNPPTENYMVTKSFKKMENTAFLNCPQDWKPVDFNNGMCISANGDSCVPNNVDAKGTCKYTQNDNAQMTRKPQKNAFLNEFECMSWCKNNDDCAGVSTNYTNKGELECRYYNEKMFNNNTRFNSQMPGNTVYKKKQQDNDYVYNIKSYTESLLDNSIPMKPSLNQIINPKETNCMGNNFSFTSCMKDSKMKDLQTISRVCLDQYGEGYVADENAIEGKTPCNVSGYSRYRCNLDPTNNINAQTTDLRPPLNPNRVIETFTSGSTQSCPSYLWTTLVIIFIIAIILYLKR